MAVINNQTLENAIYKALDLIIGLGDSVTFHRIGAATYNAANGQVTSTPTETTVIAFITDYNAEELSRDEHIAPGDRRVFIRFVDLPFTPDNNDIIKIGGDKWRIIKFSDIGYRHIVYEFQVRFK